MPNLRSLTAADCREVQEFNQSLKMYVGKIRERQRTRLLSRSSASGWPYARTAHRSEALSQGVNLQRSDRSSSCDQSFKGETYQTLHLR